MSSTDLASGKKDRIIGRSGFRSRAARLLATVSACALVGISQARAQDCSGAPPADLATPAMLFESLRAHTDARLLSINFQPVRVGDQCGWIYEVKLLTVSESVLELDFNANDLDLAEARGPTDDPEVLAIARRFDPQVTLVARSDSDRAARNSGGNENDDDGSGEGGEGGGDNSGSGSDNSGSGEGGEGGDNSGSGSDGGGSGEGGEGGDNSGSGSDGRGGNSGSGGGGGEGGDD